MATLTSRAVLLAQGPQVIPFLQGIVTNDVRPLESTAAGAAGTSPHRSPVYAAILTPKGKFLHDVFVHRHPDQPDALLLDVDAGGAAAALALLNRYKLRRPLTFVDASSAYRVVAAWGPGAGAEAAGLACGGPDPRLPELGMRGLARAGERPEVDAAAGAAGLAAADEAAYRELRYRLGVAEGEAEIPPGSAAPLDYNLDALSGVSYTKGCYVGQERNSFTHYRGVIRRRLMPVALRPLGGQGQEGLQGPEAGAEVVDGRSGQAAGALRAALPGAGLGLAYLRLQPALAAAEGAEAAAPAATAAEGGQAAAAAAAAGAAGAGQAGGRVELTVAAGGSGGGGGRWRVVPLRPGWWRAEWGREEEEGGSAGGADGSG